MTEDERDRLIQGLCKGFDLLCRRFRLTRWAPPGETVEALMRAGNVSRSDDCSEMKRALERVTDIAFDLAQEADVNAGAIAENQKEVDATLEALNSVASIWEHQK